MREGNLITKRVKLPLPNDPSIDEDFLRKYAESKPFLKQVIVLLTFKHINEIAFIDNLGR